MPVGTILMSRMRLVAFLRSFSCVGSVLSFVFDPQLHVESRIRRGERLARWSQCAVSSYADICAQRCAVSFELALAHFNFQHPASATCCDGRLIALTAIKRPFSDQGTIVPSAAKLFHGLDAGTAAGGVESCAQEECMNLIHEAPCL